MAAAPDLLQALRWSLAELNMRGEKKIPSVRQAIEAARVAIKRAEGKR